MREQFFGKPFWIILSGLAATFLSSVFLFQSEFSLLFLCLVSVAVVVVTWRRPEYGVIIAFAELFANSHGHLVSAEFFGFSFSLRMAIFVGVMVGFFGLFAREKITAKQGGVSFPWPGLSPAHPYDRSRPVGRVSAEKRRLLAWRSIRFVFQDRRLWMFLPLFCGIMIGFLIGVFRHPALEAFKDGNAYLYLGYVFPILSISWTSVRKRLLFQTLLAASVWVVFLGLGLLYSFTHFSSDILSPMYTFIRDTRTGELTRLSGGLFRIFFQAQFSAVVSIILITIFAWLSPLAVFRKRTLSIFLLTNAALFSAVFISLSRSFWIALFASAVAITTLILLRDRPKTRSTVVASVRMLASIALGFAILVAVIIFPPRSMSFQKFSGAFLDRTSYSEDVAISSRWNLLGPLVQEIREAPVFGKGFGETVTFFTDDPRARAVSPDGTWTTVAFEWGWLDVWLKTGLLGVLGFLALFTVMIYGLWPEKRSPQAWIGYGAVGTLIMLYVTNIFTPYLNHPLGLGLILFWLPFLKQKTVVLVFQETAILDPVQMNVAPAMSACPRMNLATSVVDEPSA